MSDPPSTSSSDTAASPTPPPSSQALTLIQPSTKKKHRATKLYRVFRNVLRSFPIITPAACRLPSLPSGRLPEGKSNNDRITGTLFGYRKGRVSLSIQENPRTIPMMVVELAMLTHVLQKELSQGLLRIALECEKSGEKEKDKIKLLEQPHWTMYCNGKKNGYGVRREATEEDLYVMEVLRPVSMGAGVMPPRTEAEGELAYMRSNFERVVGSKDSETLYMLSPDGSDGPELSIFFVRV